MNKGTAESDVQLFRFSYDNFLDRFPLAFGYWIKYAETEFLLGNTETAACVYERGIGSNPVSVELWAAYAQFKIRVCHKPDEVRAFLERGVTAVGTHFYAHSFWDVYVDYERREAEHTSKNAMEKLVTLLSRVVRIPMHQYAKYFDLLRELSRQLKGDELNWVKKGKDKNITNTYVNTQAETSKRWAYEQAFPRQFFHIVFPKEEDLQAWRRYLDFEESEGSMDRVRMLYERAVAATAHNEELWLRYIRFMQTVTSSLRVHREEVGNLFRRACSLLPIGRLEVRHLYAAHCEALGELALAHDIYMSILTAFPSSVETIMLFVNFERRYGYSQILAKGKSVKRQTAVPLAVQMLSQYLEDENALRNVEKCELLGLLVNYLQAFPGQTPTSVRDYLTKYKSTLKDEYKFWKIAISYEMSRTQKPAKDLSALTFEETLAAVGEQKDAIEEVDEKSMRVAALVEEALTTELGVVDKKALIKQFLAFIVDQSNKVQDYEKFSALLYSLGSSRTTPAVEPLEKPGSAATANVAVASATSASNVP